MRTLLAFILSSQVSWGALQTGSSTTHGVSPLPTSLDGTSATIAVWIYRVGAGVPFSVGGATERIQFYLDNSTTQFSRIGSATHTAELASGISASQWQHLVGVSNGNDAILYTNGVPAKTNTVSMSSLTATDTFLFARRSTTLGLHMANGSRVSHCAVWNVPLTADEIASLAAGASPDKIQPANLVFYAPLSNIGPGGGSGSSVNIMGPPLLLTNTVTQSTTQPRIYR